MKIYTFLDYYRMKPQFLPEGVEVIRGQTPAGGTYAVILYLDENGRKTAKENAVRIDVVECSAEGKEIFRTNMTKK